MRWTKMALLAAIESVYGTDEEPGNDDAQLIIVDNVSLDPVRADADTQRVVKAAGAHGSPLQRFFGKHMMLGFDIHLMGSGTAETPVRYAPMLVACGLDETITGADPGPAMVEYDPIDDPDDADAVSIYFHIDDHKYTMTGTRGDLSLNFPANRRGFVHFDMVGLFNALEDDTFPVPSYPSSPVPLEVNSDNTTITLHSATPLNTGVVIRLNTGPAFRGLVNEESIALLPPEPSAEITIQDVTVATKNWQGIMVAETLGALQVVHGTTGGNIIQVDGSNVQLLPPRPGEDARRTMRSMGLSITGAFKLTTK